MNHKPFTPNKISIAGARTSVSAPLGVCREMPVPMGRERIGIGATIVSMRRSSEHTVRPGPIAMWRVLGPFRGLCVSERIGGSGPRDVCAFGREMSVDDGHGGQLALGATG